MYARLKKSEEEINNYLEVIKGKDEQIAKYDNLEKNMRIERKKMKKERQKIAKKDKLNIRQENSV